MVTILVPRKLRGLIWERSRTSEDTMAQVVEQALEVFWNRTETARKLILETGGGTTEADTVSFCRFEDLFDRGERRIHLVVKLPPDLVSGLNSLAGFYDVPIQLFYLNGLLDAFPPRTWSVPSA